MCVTFNFQRSLETTLAWLLVMYRLHVQGRHFWLSLSLLFSFSFFSTRRCNLPSVITLSVFYARLASILTPFPAISRVGRWRGGALCVIGGCLNERRCGTWSLLCGWSFTLSVKAEEDAQGGMGGGSEVSTFFTPA